MFFFILGQHRLCFISLFHGISSKEEIFLLVLHDNKFTENFGQVQVQPGFNNASDK